MGFQPDNPLPDSATGFFGIINGNLTLWQESGISYFSTSLGCSHSTAKLLDSGNLVVRFDQSGKSLWESFNHPTDTFLPGMNMNANLKLTSLTRPDDPTSGNFTFQQDEEVKNGYIVLKSGIVYWKSRETGSFNNYNLYDPVAVFLNSSNSIQSNAGTILNSPNERLLMNSFGQVQYFIWRDSKTGSSGWSLIWSEPRDLCSVYNACGDFGSCNINNNNRWLCKCLPGFEPTSQDSWDSGDFSSGCNRKSAICGGDKEMFLNLTMMKVGKPDTLLSEVQNEEGCRKECLDNCQLQCQAFSYNEANNTRRESPRHGCWIWTSVLSNLQEEYATDGHNISVRVVASCIGQYSADDAWDFKELEESITKDYL